MLGPCAPDGGSATVWRILVLRRRSGHCIRYLSYHDMLEMPAIFDGVEPPPDTHIESLTTLNWASDCGKVDIVRQLLSTSNLSKPMTPGTQR